MNKRLKIAHVITRMDWGGSPDIVRILLEKLPKDSFDIYLITGLTLHPSKKTNEFLRNFKEKVYIISSLIRDIDFIKDVRAFFCLYQFFRKGNFDIVHTHTAKAGALGRLAAYFAGVPVIIHTAHGNNFYGYFGRIASGLIVWAERVLGLITKKEVALTELEKKDLITFKIVPENKVELIYQGLELEKLKFDLKERISVRKDLGISDFDCAIGLIGRLEPVKGGKYFIEAAKLVIPKVNPVKFIVVGEGSQRSELMNLVKTYGIESRFIFTGWRDDVDRIISGLDILVLPSLNEAVGIVLLEAQAIGVPVIASRVGGVPEIVNAPEAGVLIPSADVKALAEAIEFLSKDEGARKRISEAAKIWVKNKFKAEDMARAHVNLYNVLVK